MLLNKTIGDDKYALAQISIGKKLECGSVVNNSVIMLIVLLVYVWQKQSE